jgi:hypothetical protein
MNALLYTHQGWTDIVNCLALINYHAERYKRLYILVREDAKWLILFYIRGLRNVIPIFRPKHDLDFKHWSASVDPAIGSLALEFLGVHDRHRIDQYKGAWGTRQESFEWGFYEWYGVPYETRVSKFKLYRAPEDEAKRFAQYAKTEPYICVHSNPALGLHPPVTSSLPIVELHESSPVFFDMLKVLMHATEIHLIDSVWAAICYQVDASEGLLSHIPITVYDYRGYGHLFTGPKRLPNWTIVSPKL